MKDLIERGVRMSRSAPLIICLARFVAGEAAPKERVRVLHARFKIPVLASVSAWVMQSSPSSRVLLSRAGLSDIASQCYANLFNVTGRAYSRAEHCGYLEVCVHRTGELLPGLERNLVGAA